jgi:hypothetical protein
LKKTTLIYNPVAGRKPAKRERQIREAAEALTASGLDLNLPPQPDPGMQRISPCGPWPKAPNS